MYYPLLVSLIALAGAIVSCSAGSSNDSGLSGKDAGLGDGASSDSPTDGRIMRDGNSTTDSGPVDVLIIETGGNCEPTCAADFKAVVDCNDKLIQMCPAGQLCAAGVCAPACEATRVNRSSVGCEYYPTVMDTYRPDSCFAAFIANTWDQPAHVKVSYNGVELPIATFARIPQGTGTSLTYGAYHPEDGIAPGQVAILFLHQSSASGGAVRCPSGILTATDASAGQAQLQGTGFSKSYHVTTDVPVVAYQIYPYGGGSAAVTGASLLLPTSAWDTNYVAVNAYAHSTATGEPPSLNLIAAQDGTEITLLPRVPVQGGGGVVASPANTPMKITLNAGQNVQITQREELTGSPIESNKPIGLMAGHKCLNVPTTASYCDHAEQQIPPVRALGNEYACVTHRPRSSVPENPPWRIIGAVDDTTLTFDPVSVHPTTTVGLGQVIEFNTATPFVVRSQDDAHPFIVTGYMTGSSTVQTGYGDADFVRMVPTDQYLNRYVFFTDPTYPETNLVVVRAKDKNNTFHDVTLPCRGTLQGWTAVDTSAQYEFTRIDLIRHNFQSQSGCSNGRHEMSSQGSFGLWVWGWGTPETDIFTANVSYGYPAGENVRAINEVYVPPVPK